MLINNSDSKYKTNISKKYLRVTKKYPKIPGFLLIEIKKPASKRKAKRAAAGEKFFFKETRLRIIFLSLLKKATRYGFKPFLFKTYFFKLFNSLAFTVLKKRVFRNKLNKLYFFTNNNGLGYKLLPVLQHNFAIGKKILSSHKTIIGENSFSLNSEDYVYDSSLNRLILLTKTLTDTSNLFFSKVKPVLLKNEDTVEKKEGEFLVVKNLEINEKLIVKKVFSKKILELKLKKQAYSDKLKRIKQTKKKLREFLELKEAKKKLLEEKRLQAKLEPKKKRKSAKARFYQKVREDVNSTNYRKLAKETYKLRAKLRKKLTLDSKKKLISELRLKMRKRRLPFILYLKKKKNNFYINLHTITGKLIFTVYAGLTGLQGPAKSTLFAAEEVAKKCSKLLYRNKIKHAVIFLTSKVNKKINSVLWHLKFYNRGFTYDLRKVIKYNHSKGPRKRKARRI